MFPRGDAAEKNKKGTDPVDKTGQRLTNKVTKAYSAC